MEGKDRKFNLTDPQERNDYFYYKAGEEIEKLKDYVKDNTFIVYLLGKKNSGKGTYSKMLAELLGFLDHGGSPNGDSLSLILLRRGRYINMCVYLNTFNLFCIEIDIDNPGR